MAGHLRLCNLEQGQMRGYKLDDGGNAIDCAIDDVKAILRRIGRSGIILEDFKPWDKIQIGTRTLRRLPDTYLPPAHSGCGYTALDMGTFGVGEEIVHGGEAIFELHYNQEEDRGVLFLVA